MEYGFMFRPVSSATFYISLRNIPTIYTTYPRAVFMMTSPTYSTCTAEPIITAAGGSAVVSGNPLLQSCLGTPILIEAKYQDKGFLGGAGQILK